MGDKRSGWHGALLPQCPAVDVGVGRPLAEIADDVHVSRREGSVELAVADLELARNHLDHEEAIRDKPDTIIISMWVCDLHARLVEVLDLALAAWRLSIALSEDTREPVRPPHPGPV